MTELKSGTILLKAFNDMRSRYDAYVKKFKTLPNKIFTVKNGTNYVSLKYFDVMVANKDKYVKAYKKEPLSIEITLTKKTYNVAPKPVPTPTSNYPVYMYINPASTPNYDLATIKGIGVTDILFRIAHVGGKAIADHIKSAGLVPHAWVFPNEVSNANITAMGKEGWNIHLDLEWSNHDVTANTNLVKSMRTASQGKKFTVCVKADLWDGSLYYGTVYEQIAPYCDALVPMTYTGDYGRTATELGSVVANYQSRIPGKIVPILETYKSDRDVTSKSASVLTAEYNAVKSKSNGIALFRWPYMASGFKIGTPQKPVVPILPPPVIATDHWASIEKGTKQTIANLTVMTNEVIKHCSYRYYLNGQRTLSQEVKALINSFMGIDDGANCVDYAQLCAHLARERGYGATVYGIWCAVSKVNHAVVHITGGEFKNRTCVINGKTYAGVIMDWAKLADSGGSIGQHWCNMNTATKEPGWIPYEK